MKRDSWDGAPDIQNEFDRMEERAGRISMAFIMLHEENDTYEACDDRT